MMIMAVNEVQDDVRRYLSDYLAVRELRKNVEKRLKELERERSRRPKDRKLRHSISGLRSTLRSLDNRREIILRTLNARIARSLGTLNIGGIELQPHDYAVSVNGKDKTAIYRIVEEDSEEYPLKVSVKIPRLELSRAEELVSLVGEIFNTIRERIGLPARLQIDKLALNNEELETAIDVLKRRGFKVSRQGKKLSLSSD
ncbi:MAG: hypothetical protein GXO23_02245 [Crenarchaeota archaeon]|nr:hypothetical protein [Thermoproteota archaeon]